jgi:predicted dehydrogenase
MLFVTGLKVSRVMAHLHTVHPVRNRPAGEVKTFSKEPITERVSARVTSDDVSLVWLEFENGALGSVVVSQASAGRKNDISFEIDGRDGSVAWGSQRPDELWIGHRDEPNQLLRRDPAMMSERACSISTFPSGHVEGFPDTFKGLFGKIYADLRAGAPSAEPEYPTFADGVRGLELLEAVRRSNESGTWAAVERGEQ